MNSQVSEQLSQYYPYKSQNKYLACMLCCRTKYLSIWLKANT